jgi:tetratricopeptide (TPR) repeat protein
VINPAGAVLFLALAALVVYLAFSFLAGPAGLGGQGAAALSAPVPSTPPPPTATARIRTPVQTPAAVPLTPEELDGWLAQAAALGQQSQFEEALAIYEDLARRSPQESALEVGWAWALILDGQASEAVAHARRAVELEPTSPEAATALARASLEAGDLGRALAMAQSAVELDARSALPRAALARAVLAEAYLAVGRIAEAVTEADVALAQDPGSAEAHRVRGWIYRAGGDLEGALAELQAAASLQPELWRRRYELALLLLEAQDYAPAVDALERALALRPRAETHLALGEAYYRLGQYDQAMDQAQRALSGGAEAGGLLAAIYARQDRCDEAEANLSQVTAGEPGDPLAQEARQICEPEPPAPTAEPGVSGSLLPSEPSPPSPPVLQGRIAFPVWNPDSGEYDTYLSQAGGSERQLVAAGVHQPAFSPDGRWLAVNGEQSLRENLLLVRPDGSEVQEITEHIEDGLPAWAPGGRRLAFSSTQHGDRQSRVYVLDPVPRDGRKAPGRALNAGPDDVRGAHPAWTPGGEILYAGCDHTSSPVPCGLLLMPAGPGSHTPVPLTTAASDTAPAVHGDRVAFMSERDGNWEIYRLNLDGTGLVRLTDDAANDGLPAWSPDGRWIAFVSDRGGAWAVWAVEPDGGNQQKLFDLGGGGLAADWQQQQISWGP